MDNATFLYLPDSMEIASLEGLTLWCPEIKQSKPPMFIEDNDLPPCCRHCLFLTCCYRDNLIFSRNVTPETCSNTQLKTEQIQDC